MSSKQKILFSWIFFVALSIICFYLTGFLYFQAASQINKIETASPTDLLHQVLPAINLYGLLKLGMPITILLLLIGALKKIYRFPYLIFSVVIWWLSRILFVCTTIFAVPPDRPTGSCGFFLIDFLNQIIPNGIIEHGQTFMFSGHTGLPFLGACLFYSSDYPFLNKKWFRKNWLSLTLFFWSLIMGTATIVNRSHYTIDVLAAWGVTFTIYCITRKLLQPMEYLGEKLKNRLQSKAVFIF